MTLIYKYTQNTIETMSLCFTVYENAQRLRYAPVHVIQDHDTVIVWQTREQ